ncbi:MAG: SRPBCC family protein [Hyphomicrobium sp.]
MTAPPFQVVVTNDFAATPEQVFDAWLDPVGAAHWMFAAPSGEMIRAEIDPTVGGEFCFVDRRDDEDIEHLGEYTVLDRPQRLAFVFSVNRSDDFSRVAIALEPLAKGCRLTLTHEMDARFAPYGARTRDGWTRMLDGLARTLGEG